MTIIGAAADAPDVLSIGRVQTPTLALCGCKDNEIANFKPVDFFAIKGNFTADTGEFLANFIFPENQAGLDDAGRLVDAAIAKKLVKEFQGKDGKQYVRQRRKRNKTGSACHIAFLPCAKAASSKLGMSAQQVLDTAQKLYEKS